MGRATARLRFRTGPIISDPFAPWPLATFTVTPCQYGLGNCSRGEYTVVGDSSSVMAIPKMPRTGPLAHVFPIGELVGTTEKAVLEVLFRPPIETAPVSIFPFTAPLR